MTIAPEDILDFWYNELGGTHWWTPDPAVGEALRTRFIHTYEQAAHGGMLEWENNPTGMLALILLLSVFPRHMFAGTARAFETDESAMDLARNAIIQHFDDRIEVKYKLVFYLPFTFSEKLGDQRLSLFYIRERTKNERWLGEAERAHGVIQQFGRFPDQNEALGRASTADEQAWLAGDQGRHAGLRTPA